MRPRPEGLHEYRFLPKGHKIAQRSGDEKTQGSFTFIVSDVTRQVLFPFLEQSQWQTEIFLPPIFLSFHKKGKEKKGAVTCFKMHKL